MSWFAAKLTGESVDPWKLNPWRQGQRRPARAVVTVSEEESRIGWAAIDSYFRR